MSLDIKLLQGNTAKRNIFYSKKIYMKKAANNTIQEQQLVKVKSALSISMELLLSYLKKNKSL